MFEGLFQPKVLLFKKKDRAQWEAIRTALKDAGMKGVSATHYYQEEVQACGCGAKLDPRDFGSKGKIDRDIYMIRVCEKDEKEAREILRSNGLTAEIDQDLLKSAPYRCGTRS